MSFETGKNGIDGVMEGKRLGQIEAKQFKVIFEQLREMENNALKKIRESSMEIGMRKRMCKILTIGAAVFAMNFSPANLRDANAAGNLTGGVSGFHSHAGETLTGGRGLAQRQEMKHMADVQIVGGQVQFTDKLNNNRRAMSLDEFINRFGDRDGNFHFERNGRAAVLNRNTGYIEYGGIGGGIVREPINGGITNINLEKNEDDGLQSVVEKKGENKTNSVKEKKVNESSRPEIIKNKK